MTVPALIELDCDGHRAGVALGDPRVRILPNHACATAAMHDRYHVLDGDDVVGIWETFRGW